MSEVKTCYGYVAGAFKGPAAAAIVGGSIVAPTDTQDLNSAFTALFDPLPTGTVGQRGDVAVYTGHVAVFIAPGVLLHLGPPAAWLDIESLYLEAAADGGKASEALTAAVHEAFTHRGPHEVPEQALSDARGQTPRICRPKDPSIFDPSGLTRPGSEPSPPGPNLPKRTGPRRPRKPAPGPEPAPKPAPGRPFGAPGGMGPGQPRPMPPRPPGEPEEGEVLTCSNGLAHGEPQVNPQVCPKCKIVHIHEHGGMMRCWCGIVNPGYGKGGR